MKFLAKALLGLSLALAIIATNTQTAEAGRGRGGAFAAGIATGILGMGIIGAAEARRRAGGACYRGRRVCETVEPACFENRYGDYICPDVERRCYRPLICD